MADSSTGDTTLQDRIAEVLARVLPGCPVVTETDKWGQHLTNDSARVIAELVATDVVDSLGLTQETHAHREQPGSAVLQLGTRWVTRWEQP